ncbi:EamA family transporter [Telluria beijingensis]|uniref:EamA family transporter n=1 Tax=Telluria beijingensis TaxID=3068633 RepID=UPI0027962185|nr:EamA family transporter [Massilia sp. REN29]
MKPLHLLAAIGVVAIWGCNFVVIKLGLDELPPLLLCALRFLFAALPAVFFVKRPHIPFSGIVAYGLVMFGLQFAFLFGGMALGISAGLASLALQLQSFLTIALAAWLLGDRPTYFQVGGALLALGGIAVIGANTGGDVSILGLTAVILAALAWACGNLMSKRFGRVNTVVVLQEDMQAWKAAAFVLVILGLCVMPLS